jgi:hypothetical protein
MAYRIQKQFVPVDTNNGDPDWAKRQIWVAKLNAEDSVEEFTELLRSNQSIGLFIYI